MMTWNHVLEAEKGFYFHICGHVMICMVSVGRGVGPKDNGLSAQTGLPNRLLEGDSWSIHRLVQPQIRHHSVGMEPQWAAIGNCPYVCVRAHVCFPVAYLSSCLCWHPSFSSQKVQHQISLIPMDASPRTHTHIHTHTYSLALFPLVGISHISASATQKPHPGTTTEEDSVSGGCGLAKSRADVASSHSKVFYSHLYSMWAHKVIFSGDHKRRRLDIGQTKQRDHNMYMYFYIFNFNLMFLLGPADIVACKVLGIVGHFCCLLVKNFFIGVRCWFMMRGLVSNAPPVLPQSDHG